MKTSKKKTGEDESGQEAHHESHHEQKHAEKAHSGRSEKASAHKAKVSESNWLKEPGKAYLLISVAVMVVLLGVIIFLLSKNNAPSPGAPGDGFAGQKVKVEFYVMSQCPYGTQVEDAIEPVLKKLGGAVDFRLDFILRESNGAFQSLHGEKEVKGDLVQVCANKYYPDKLIDFVVCQNKDARNVDTNWQACATELGLDSAKLGTCMNGEEGKTLLRESMNRAIARQAQGSPTIYINDVAYQGGRQTSDFEKAICRYSTHSACADLAKCYADADCTGEPKKDGTCNKPGQKDAYCTYSDPVRVDYVVLTDDKCTTCDTTRIVQVSQQLFLGGVPRVVDIDTPEGKGLIAKYKLTVAPAYIFDSSITNTRSWSNVDGLSTAFDALSDGKYRLKDEVTGAAYFVSEEARIAYEAAQKKLAEEKLAALGAKAGDNKPQIDFFVMSYCPFGNQAEEGIAPVYNLLKGKADFKPHYVIYSNYGGGGPNYCLSGDVICSMHGIQELHQNIREACVYKYDGIGKWFDFVLAMNKQCTSQNADACWEAVAKGLSLNVERIKTCQANEGEALMTVDKDLGDKLQVQGSPTVFIDGVDYTGGRAPESFKTALCAAFETAPAECQTKLQGEAAAGSAGAPAAGCGV